MCGLAGMVLSKKERTEAELWSIRATFSKLMVATQIRGTHATGGFIVNPEGITYHKSDLPASQMVKTDGWKEFMSKITNETVAVVGHVRYATHGKPEVNANNHPILKGNIIGVHNGVLMNDCELCDKYPYTEDVDSAAIFSMLNAHSAKKRLNTTIITKALPELEGDFAIICADTRRLDSIFVARDGNRPLVYIKDTLNEIIWLSSTGEILRDGLGNKKIKPVMLPAFSVARISRNHAKPNAPVKVSHWYSAPKFIEIPESKGEYSTASLWEALGDTED
jgi:glucosamine 6-phosphate synthetase-like amidotransferase/phosphosugar isomerase protein